MIPQKISLSKKILSLLIVVSFILPFAYVIAPQKADAQISKCMPQFLSMFGITTTKNTVTAVASVPVFIPGQVLPQSQQAANAQSNFLKDCIEKGLALALAKMILAQITQSIVDWINGGFSGQPSFVQNPGDFAMGIADQVAGAFILGSDLAFLCSPFKLQVQLALALNYNSSGYGGQLACTLSEVINNIEGFYQDFSQGGWLAWNEMTQNSNNNPYGAYLNAQSILMMKVSSAQQNELIKLNWGSGFMSMEECGDGSIKFGSFGSNGGSTVSSGNNTQTPEQGEYDSNGVISPQANGSYGTNNSNNCKITTPGKLIEGTMQKQLDLPLEQLGVADDLDKIFNALGNQLLKQVMGGIGGLLGASSRTGGGSSGGRSALDNFVNDARRNADRATSTANSNYQQLDDLGNTNTNTDSSPTFSNIASGKNVTMSTYGNNKMQALVNGDKTDGYDDTYTGAVTSAEAQPWVQIDLGQTEYIDRVVIFQRTNPSDSSKKLSYNVQILSAGKFVIWTSPAQEQDFRSGPTEIKVAQGTRGRFIKIQGYAREGQIARMELSEVEVYKVNAPTITLKGDSVMNISLGQTFTDPGYSATDMNDGDVTSRVTKTGSVDTSKVGSYTLTYTVTNSAGLDTSKTRQVVVIQQSQSY